MVVFVLVWEVFCILIIGTEMWDKGLSFFRVLFLIREVRCEFMYFTALKYKREFFVYFREEFGVDRDIFL